MTKEQVSTVVEEAARLLRENPDWTYKKAIDNAKELMASEIRDRRQISNS